MSTHTAIAITTKGQFDAIQVSTEVPGQGEILLKVEYSSMVTFDTYMTDLGYAVDSYPMVLGFNASGTVAKLGPGVDDLIEGDRITASSFITSRSKGMQEYSVLPRTVCAKIPESLSLDAAATIPDNFITAFYTLFNQLSLPIPSSFPASSPPPLASVPILIYGAGSTSGQYAIQLLHSAGYKNIIATASDKHHNYLRSLGATSTFDYKNTDIVNNIAAVAGGDGKVALAVDCIATMDTLTTVAGCISPLGTLAILLPIKISNTLTVQHADQMLWDFPKGEDPLPKSTKVVRVRTFLYQEQEFLKENLMPRILPSLLESGIIKPNRVRLMDEGTLKERVATGLDLLRNNKVSGEKVVVKVQA